MNNLTFGELWGQGSPILEILKSPIQNGGTIVHLWDAFLIRKGLNIRGTD